MYPQELEVYEYARYLKYNKDKFENSIIIFTGFNYNLFVMAPYLTKKEGLQLYNKNQKYNYEMASNSISDTEIQDIAENSEKPVFIFRSGDDDSIDSVDYNKYTLIENYKDVILVYKVK